MDWMYKWLFVLFLKRDLNKKNLSKSVGCEIIFWVVEVGTSEGQNRLA